MKRWNSLITTIVFLLFIFGIAAAGLLLPDRKFSQLENRYLKLQPDWSLHRMMNGLWMDEMEDYLSDQIAGRDLWICLQGWSERLSGKKENNGVYFGKKDTLISRVEEPNERLLFQNVDYVNSLAEQAGVLHSGGGASYGALVAGTGLVRLPVLHLHGLHGPAGLRRGAAGQGRREACLFLQAV